MIKPKSGKKSEPKRTVIYGPEGVGKSLLTSTFPEPIFIDVEKGTADMDVTRYEPDSMGEINLIIKSLLNDPHDYKTVILDTIDWVEKRMAVAVCARYNVDSIEKVDGGYGKGYTILEEDMMDFLSELDKLREKRGMNIVLLAHSKVQKYEDPELAASYDRHQLKLEKKTAALLKEWPDALIFFNFETKVTDRIGSMAGKRGVGGKKRFLRTQREAAFDAKERVGLDAMIEVKEKGVFPEKLTPLFRYHLEAKSSPHSTPKQESPEETPEQSESIDGDPWGEMDAVIELCGGRENVEAFLQSRDKSLDDLDESYIRRVLSASDQFIQQVKEHSVAA